MPKYQSAKEKVRARIKKARKKEVQIPLLNEILNAKEPGKLKPIKTKIKNKKYDNDVEEETYVDAITSKKILQTAQEQQRELSGESNSIDRTTARIKLKNNDNFDDTNDLLAEADGEDYEVQLSVEDEKSLNLFMPNSAPVRQTLADIIMAKIQEKNQLQDAGLDSSADVFGSSLDPKIVQVYQHVGACMNKYKSGKVPKAFKVIPSLRNWEDVLYLTSPEKWSSQATYVATKLFASNLNDKMAQRYYNLVLLPKVVEDIEQNKCLNYHLYQSVIKAVYKPAAFFKGLFLPLVEEGCSLRVAIIMASILAKISIPVLHAGVALLKMSKMPFSSALAIFMKTLLNKKYALPYQVIDSLVEYFVQFRENYENEKLPVIWHQNLLTFVQRYKKHFKMNQRNELKSLVQHHFHHQITPEIRREMFSVDNNNSMNIG